MYNSWSQWASDWIGGSARDDTPYGQGDGRTFYDLFAESLPIDRLGGNQDEIDEIVKRLPRNSNLSKKAIEENERAIRQIIKDDKVLPLDRANEYAKLKKQGNRFIVGNVNGIDDATKVKNFLHQLRQKDSAENAWENFKQYSSTMSTAFEKGATQNQANLQFKEGDNVGAFMSLLAGSGYLKDRTMTGLAREQVFNDMKDQTLTEAQQKLYRLQQTGHLEDPEHVEKQEKQKRQSMLDMMRQEQAKQYQSAAIPGSSANQAQQHFGTVPQQNFDYHNAMNNLQQALEKKSKKRNTAIDNFNMGSGGGRGSGPSGSIVPYDQFFQGRRDKYPLVQELAKGAGKRLLHVLDAKLLPQKQTQLQYKGKDKEPKIPREPRPPGRPPGRPPRDDDDDDDQGGGGGKRPPQAVQQRQRNAMTDASLQTQLQDGSGGGGGGNDGQQQQSGTANRNQQKKRGDKEKRKSDKKQNKRKRNDQELINDFVNELGVDTQEQEQQIVFEDKMNKEIDSMRDQGFMEPNLEKRIRDRIRAGQNIEEEKQMIQPRSRGNTYNQIQQMNQQRPQPMQVEESLPSIMEVAENQPPQPIFNDERGPKHSNQELSNNGVQVENRRRRTGIQPGSLLEDRKFPFRNTLTTKTPQQRREDKKAIRDQRKRN